MEAASSPKCALLEIQPFLSALKGYMPESLQTWNNTSPCINGLRPQNGTYHIWIRKRVISCLTRVYACCITGILYWSFTLHNLEPHMIRKTRWWSVIFLRFGIKGESIWEEESVRDDLCGDEHNAFANPLENSKTLML